ncbi:HEPN domain protein [Chryseobacterium sp. MOF25P]|uniref:HEPN domain-containing protein n=1 Tax=unclassified Chryseobacterium TaxID=2593645 RepID=UPI0008053BCE|nr:MULTISPECIES: HEPN domain-containing protein [unclassified Chryseobacterium]OBW43568.1 HEPN domain protein [Chryseobacterium sp. MOF25P]OBW46658.1 HEPN domain protein [Chryseobacterium sp. BGARF1]
MNDLIKLATVDLKSAELLFQLQIFHNAIYFYHQAVEKAVKYLGLQIGIIDNNALKKIGHEPIKVFKILDEVEKVFHNEELTEFVSLIKKLTDEQLVNKTLLEIEQSTQNLYELDFNLSYFQNLRIYIADKDFPQKDIISTIEENSYYNKMAKEFFNQLNVGAVIIRMLFLNSCLCSKYKLDSYRYNSEKIENPVDYFSETNPIVLKLDIFIKSLAICLSQIENINWKN